MLQHSKALAADAGSAGHEFHYKWLGLRFAALRGLKKSANLTYLQVWRFAVYFSGQK